MQPRAGGRVIVGVGGVTRGEAAGKDPRVADVVVEEMRRRHVARLGPLVMLQPDVGQHDRGHAGRAGPGEPVAFLEIEKVVLRQRADPVKRRAAEEQRRPGDEIRLERRVGQQAGRLAGEHVPGGKAGGHVEKAARRGDAPRIVAP